MKGISHSCKYRTEITVVDEIFNDVSGCDENIIGLKPHYKQMHTLFIVFQIE